MHRFATALALIASLGAGTSDCDVQPGALSDHPTTPIANATTPTTSPASAAAQPPPAEPIASAAAPPDEAAAAGRKQIVAPVAAEKAPAASPRASVPAAAELLGKVQSWFAGHVSRRIYVQVDKPLYKPGETIWMKSWDLAARGLGNAQSPSGIRYQLVSPKGAVVLEKLVAQREGLATNDFEIPAEAQGGEYQLRAVAFDGQQGERPVVVSTYEAPRVKKKLEFVRKAYGEGDAVTATIEVKRPTGQPLANKTLTAIATVDGVELPRVALATNAEGGGLVRFVLPAPIAVGDGLLTVLVEDGGVTESISRSIPILVRKLQLSTFPEGGKLVQGLESRLYFEAKTPIGKPADVEGRIVDDQGNGVAAFATYKNGLGRVAFTPQTGRTYKAQITRPAGIGEQYALPLAEEQGCVLRTFDDLDGQEQALRAAVACTEPRKVIVLASVRENLLDAAAVEVAPGRPAVVHLASKEESIGRAEGIARVTLFDEKLEPLAERLVFRNRRSGMQVKVVPDRKAYSPRDPISLQIQTTNGQGRPVAARLAVAVVDDTVVSFADDKTGHLLSRLLLEPELPGKVEEPNFYLDLTEAKSALALDLLMGARGYRRFEWAPVLSPPPPPESIETAGGAADALGGRPEDRRVLRAEMRPAPAPAPIQKGMLDGRAPPMPPQALNLPAARPAAHAALAAPPPAAMPAMPMPIVAREEKAKRAGDDRGAGFALRVAAAPPMGELAIAADKDFAGPRAAKVEARARQVSWAQIRVFPAPAYQAGYTGPRTDFRETIHWAPEVQTGANGEATVRFFASDAVTSFRVFTEGVAGGGAGLAGRDETVLQSSLPFSLNVKLPVEVSAGDRLLVPVTLSNERTTPLDVTVDASFGALLKPAGAFGKGGALAAGARTSSFYPVDVTGLRGQSEVQVKASAGSLSDEVTRSITVVPVGFPQLISRSGQLQERAAIELDLGSAVAGTVEARLQIYPSPVSTLVSGLEGMLREPSGCFEQTSSSNYPNVMVMQYLKAHDVADPALLERSGRLLDSGYKRLAAYESPNKGYEWFGQNPGHEALTAYGLLEFADMKAVYGNVDDAMLARTANWLKSRRDGQGGYLRDPKALDSFGAASPEVTNAYITWALALSGDTSIDKELAAQARLAETTQDTYLLALAADTLLHVKNLRSQGQQAARRLAGLQDADGAFGKAQMSITRSGGQNLTTEATALAVLTLLDAGGDSGGHGDSLRRAVEWLANHRSGYGQWGATQATVLALKAMTAYDNASRKARSAGSVQVLVNGVRVADLAYEAGRREPLVLADLGSRLTEGKNRIELLSRSGDPLPYSLAVEYRSVQPASSPQSTVDVTTALAKQQLKLGETVRLTAVVTNKTAQGQPMTLARIGIPGGLSFQTWQLKELREKGAIGFYETRAREVIVYFRDLKPNEVKTVPIDLVATVPGRFTAPASSAYLYYTDEHKTWAPAVAIQIDP